MTAIASSGVVLYEQYADVIEKIVAVKVSRCTRFGAESRDDAAQKIRLICFESLKKFDHQRVGKSVYHFLARCVDNGLYNEYRGVFLDNNPPCTRCEYWDKKNKTCMIDEVGCDRIVQYRQRMARRRAIESPLSYCAPSEDNSDTINDEGINHDMLGNRPSVTGAIDLDELIKKNLDPKLHFYYEYMKTGDHRTVPLRIRRQIKEIVSKLITELS